MSTENPARYLAWDTSSLSGIISAFEVRESKLVEVTSWSLSLETSKHSERLLWSIDTVLQSAGWKLEDLSGIAVGVGPGSFTGIRIGITTARILSKSLGIPVIPISSLAILAHGTVRVLEEMSGLDLKKKKSLESVLLVACTDATKGEWFTLMGVAKSVRDCICFSEGDLPGIWGKGVVERVFPPDELFEVIKKQLKKMGPSARFIAVGQSVERYGDQWDTLPKKSRITLSDEQTKRVQASTMTKLAFEAIQQGFSRDSSLLRPRYLRGSEAEVKLAKGLLKVQPIHHRGGVA